MTDDEFLAELQRALSTEPLPALTGAQIAVRKRNHERLVRLGLACADCGQRIYEDQPVIEGALGQRICQSCAADRYLP